MRTYGDLDSKFRFCILASKRAKQLLSGAKPKIRTKSKNLILIAQNEVKERLIDYEIIQPKAETFHAPEDEAFIGEELGIGEEKILEEVPKAVEKKDAKKKAKKEPKKEKPKKQVKKKS
ncbi:DNA-directed RNA polymerase subunit omega [Acidobacteriota bacterium]